MAIYNNHARDRYNDGSDITVKATADVTGKRFAAISGDLDDGLITIGTAAPGTNTVGVIKYDAAAGELVGIARGSSRVITVTTGAAITAGDDVQVGDGGRAIPAPAESTGIIVGYSVNTVAAGADALISLNR